MNWFWRFVSARVHSSQQSQAGIALISLLVFMTVALVIAVSSVSLVINRTQSSNQISSSMQALNLAESGVENAMLKLIRDPNYIGEVLQLPEGVVIIHVSGQDPYNISAEATVGNFIKTVDAEVSFFGGTLQIISFGEVYYDCSPLPWYDEDWEYRIKSVIRSAKVSGSTAHTDFPMLYSFKEPLLAGHTQPQGQDIVFVGADGSKLDHEIEKFDPDTGEIAAWVKIPSLSPNQDTPLYMYYGNPSAPDQQNTAAVWSNGYEAVYHLHNDFLDSTGNNRHGTNNGTIDVKGIVGDAQDWEYYHGFDYIDIGNWNVPGQQMTLEAWAMYESFGHDWARLISKSNANTYPGVNFMLATWDWEGKVVPRSMFRTSSSQSTIHFPKNTTYAMETNKWYQMASTFDGSLNSNHVTLVRNADVVLVENKSDVPPRNNFQNNWSIYIGNNPVVFDRNIDGKIDEVRISSVVRSPDWLITQYNNISLPTSFAKSCGPETELMPPPTPTITPTPYPSAPAWCAGTVWFHPDWSHRQRLTILASQVAGSSDMLDFPVYVTLSDSTLAAVARSDGGDIRFVDINGLPMNYELEHYDSNTGTIHAWVRVHTLSATANTSFYIYYGNSIAQSESNPDGLWNDEYGGVYHFASNPVGTPPQILDSTLEHSGTANGLMTSTDVVPGKVGLATDFDGTDDYVQIGGIYGGHQSHVALAGWVKLDTYSKNHAILSRAFGHDTYPRIFYQSATDQLWLQYGVDGSSHSIIFTSFSSTIPAGTWFHYSAVFNAAQTRVDFKINNGQLAGSNTHAFMNYFNGSGFLPRIGYDSNLGYRLDGQLDEMRFYYNSMDSNWLSTEYANQSNPSAFLTIDDPDVRAVMCVSPTPVETPLPTLSPTPPAGAVQSLRVTTYEIEAGAFSGATYTLQLLQPLSSQYFTVINGGSNQAGFRGPLYDAARVAGDPFGHLGSLTAANELFLSRASQADGESWQGSITVVECISDCEQSGFMLREVKEVVLPQVPAGEVQAVTVGLDSPHTARTVPFGGIRGGGVSTPAGGATEYATTMGIKFRKVGTQAIELSRRSLSGAVAQQAEVTVYVVEWGAEWLVQSVNVIGSNGGAGADAVSEYNVGVISQVARDSTWVWGSGYTANSDLQRGALSQVITLGNGVARNSTEEIVAVGSDAALTSPGRNFQVYTMTHPRLLTGYDFKFTGDPGPGQYQEMTSAVGTPVSSENYDNASSTRQYTTGFRLPLVFTTSGGSHTNYPIAGAWASRLVADTTLQYWRMTSGEPYALWLQTVDFGGVVGQPGALPTATIAPTPTSPATATLCVDVIANTNDGQENLSSGAVTLSGTTLGLGYSGGNPQLVGLRFTDVAILQGTTITDAKLFLTANGNSSSTTNLTIWGEDSINSAGFTTANGNLSGRTKTSQSVSWSSVPSWTTGIQYETPSISSLVQSIVNKPGWSPGNAMTFVISGTGQRIAHTHESDPTKAGELCITYLANSGISPTPTPTPTTAPPPTATPTPVCTTYNSTNVPVVLPNGVSSIQSELTIPAYGSITKMNVITNMSHTWPGDVAFDIRNVSTGTSVRILDRPGVPASTYGCSTSNIVATFDDGASTQAETMCNSSPPGISGTVRPNNLLNAFNGQQMNGTWRFTVTDYYTSADAGTLNSWGVYMCYIPQPSPTPTLTPTPTFTPTPTLTPTPVPGGYTIRTTTYEFQDAQYSGSTYTLALNAALSPHYFVMINGASDQTSSRGPNQDGVRVVGDPFGNLPTTTSATQLALARSNSSFDWIGSVTVVECLASCTTQGFQLREILNVSLPQGSANSTQTVTTSLASNYTSRTVPFGGLYGGGIQTSASSQNEWGVSLGVKIEKFNSNQLRLLRYGAESRIPRSADMTIYVVEWGNAWSVQTATVTGTNVGSGINNTGSYNTASISSVTRANTWVWGSGYTRDDGMGDGAFGQVITLGNGVTQNATENQVAVGAEVNMISPGRDFEVYIMSHPNIAVDHRFKTSGHTGGASYQALSLTVNTGSGPETYNNSSSTIRYTQGHRLAFFYGSSTSSGQQYPAAGGWGFRLTAGTTLLYWRPFAGYAVAGWAQVIDFAGVTGS